VGRAADHDLRHGLRHLRGLHPGGYIMHKYRADGALGSSWHPYVHGDGITAPPIQEDETALVLFVFAEFYHMHPSPRLLKEFYEPFVLPMANFLASYIDEATGLPKPSYDLWEEQFLTSTYTTAVTHAALLAAAELAEIIEDGNNAVKWRTAASDILAAAHKYLYNSDRQAFYKGVLVKDGHVEYNNTFDLSSIFGVFMFGLYPIDSEEVQTSIQTLTKLFGVDTGTIGLPRYENDAYRRVSPNVTGNWWIISSLWLAQYYIEIDEKEKASKIIAWVQQHGSHTGMLAEQLSPLDESPVSVEPLTWSHAEFLATLLDTIATKDKDQHGKK
jgi:GH15 family glucan-1,4-alpha-glucosidase